MCHNAIEAMAVGSIPIVAYADWFDPCLEHGKNAIIYSGKEDLVNKIKIVQRMTYDQIQHLRKGCLEYYDKYLAKGCLARKYEQQAQYISTLMLFTNFISDPKENAEAEEFKKRFEEMNIPEGALK